MNVVDVGVAVFDGGKFDIALRTGVGGHGGESGGRKEASWIAKRRRRLDPTWLAVSLEVLDVRRRVVSLLSSVNEKEYQSARTLFKPEHAASATNFDLFFWAHR